MQQLLPVSWKLNPISIAKIAISIFYAVGIAGLIWEETRSIFQFLTPFHLLLSAIILFYFHQDWNKAFLVFGILTFLIGMSSEIIGVKTGLIFGDYIYGPVLGLKLMEVPLIIGVNWLILAYMWGKLSGDLNISRLYAAIVASIGMVAMDFLIEPVAIALDFWQWTSGDIPFSNYLGWLGIAFLIQLSFQFLPFQKKNTISSYLLVNMCLFFAILNFLL
ncbi:carotenoid biosynthesis protein [Pleomorphovibrio marinus]|uniref:carotenoid biosynthesis protein n=1 Tax=Pleomorphovibrio marinus TaxID=2164132 RepID=UPI001E3B63C2|nr:carotenoid biosynthesis protein [Pleomorphovibrio marinus]